jgi:hypothetical protein
MAAGQKQQDWWRGQVRIPEPMMEWMRVRAQSNFRSLNAELVELIREAKRADDAQKLTQQ